MHILYLNANASISSTVIHATMNSDPKVNVSTVFYCLEYHKIGALLQKMMVGDLIAGMTGIVEA